MMINYITTQTAGLDLQALLLGHAIKENQRKIFFNFAIKSKTEQMYCYNYFNWLIKRGFLHFSISGAYGISSVTPIN